MISGAIHIWSGSDFSLAPFSFFKWKLYFIFFLKRDKEEEEEEDLLSVQNCPE